jgi:hypothetical protein
MAPRRKNKLDKSKPKPLPPKNEQVAELIENDSTEPPKKRGRKKRTPSNLMKPEDVIDYMIRTYPKMQLDKIKNHILTGLIKRNTEMERLYVLDELIVGEYTYFCDSGGTVLNDDAQICGFVIDSDKEAVDKEVSDKEVSDKEVSDKEVSDKEAVDKEAVDKEAVDKEILDKKLLDSNKSIKKLDKKSKKKKTKYYKKGKTYDKKNVNIHMFYTETDDRTFKETIDSIEKR